MKKLLTIGVISLFLASCGETVQGNGQVKKETRETAPFEALDISGGYEVHLRPANYSSLTIEADGNLLEHIETYVKDGTLHVSSDVSFSRYRELDLYITLENFKGLESSGAVEVSGQGMLRGEDIEFDLSGAAEVELELQAETIEGEFKGACEVVLSGITDRLDIKTSGAVEFDGENLKSRKCRIKMSGAGEAVVYATEELDIEVSGAAEIRYKGQPANIKQDISGAASIDEL